MWFYTWFVFSEREERDCRSLHRFATWKWELGQTSMKWSRLHPRAYLAAVVFVFLLLLSAFQLQYAGTCFIEHLFHKSKCFSFTSSYPCFSLCGALFSSSTTACASCIIFRLVGNLLDELSHVLTQCFTARPLALSMAVERMGAGMLLMAVERESHNLKTQKEITVRERKNKKRIVFIFPEYIALICHTLIYKHTHAKLNCSSRSVTTAIWVWLAVISLYSSQSQVQTEEDGAEWGQLQKPGK